MTASSGKGYWRRRLKLSIRLGQFLIFLMALAMTPIVIRSSAQRRVTGMVRHSGGQVSVSPLWWSRWVPQTLQAWIGEEYFEDLIGVDFRSSPRLASDQLQLLSELNQLNQVDLRGSLDR